MSKGFWLGVSLTTAAAAVAYHSLSDEKKEELANTIKDVTEDLKDRFVDYTMYAEDLADDWRQTAEDYYDDASEKVKQTGDKIRDKKDSIVDGFNGDDFDAQTASIRDQLASTAHTDDEDVTDTDIVIDQTDDEPDSEETETTE